MFGIHATRRHTPLFDHWMVLNDVSTLRVKFSPLPLAPNTNQPCLPSTSPSPPGWNTGIRRDPFAPCTISVGPPPCSIFQRPVRFVCGVMGAGGGGAGGAGGPPGHPEKSHPGQLNDGLWSPAGSSVAISISTSLNAPTAARSVSGGSNLPAVSQFAAVMLKR